MQELQLKIENFEGPFDLLLHLIKKTKIDIIEVALSEVIDQYLEIIDSSNTSDNFEIASEYLEIAAELLKIKTIALLPIEDLEEYDENYERDYKKELITRLLEYKKYKETVEYFEDNSKNRGIYYDIPQINVSHMKEKVESIPISKVIEAMQNVLQRFEYDHEVNSVVMDNPLSVPDRISHITNVLKSKKTSFKKLCEGNKEEAVTSFLAILEMLKENLIKFSETEDDLLFEYIGKNEGEV